MKKKKTKDPAKMSAAEQVEFIKQQMGWQTFEKPQRCWLNTGSPRLNAVLGSKKRGIAFGKSITLAGKPSSGKTWLAIKIAGMAQKLGAKVAYVDVEISADPKWSKIHGLDFGDPVRNMHGRVIGYTKVALFRPEMGKFEKKDKKTKNKFLITRLEAAEELFNRVEKWMILQRELDPDVKMCVIVDSTTAVQPKEELEAGLTDQNMRSKMLAPFLNRLTKGWVSLAYHTNAIIIYIAQLRTNPAMRFGNPEYITGGNGVLYYPSVICKVHRVKKGLLLSGEEAVGVKSIISNHKNKSGGGSVEGRRCGFKAYFHRSKWKFLMAKKLEAEK